MPFGGDAREIKHLVPRGLPVPLWMVGAGMLVAFLVFAWLYVRWSLAIPSLALEGVSLTEAARRSVRRTRGAFWSIARAHLRHYVMVALISIALIALLRLALRPLIAALLQRAPESGPIALAVLVVSLSTLLGTLSSSRPRASSRSPSYTTSRSAAKSLASRSSPRPTSGAASGSHSGSSSSGPARLRGRRRGWRFRASKRSSSASRGTRSSRRTVAGRSKRPRTRSRPCGMRSRFGAEVAEMDVQQAKDGTIVVVHDPNLKRLAGVDQNVGELTFAELARLDVGSHFSPEFANERIPTLEQMLDAAQGRHPGGHRDQDQQARDRLLRRRRDPAPPAEGLRRRCMLTSLEPPFLQRIRELAPKIKLGAIITAKVGSASDLDVDFYCVQPLIASSDFIREAHADRREVQVWTINEPDDISRFADRSVDVILSDTPRVARDGPGRPHADGRPRGAARRLFRPGSRAHARTSLHFASHRRIECPRFARWP